MSRRLVVEWTRTTLRVALADGHGARLCLRALQARPIREAGELGETLRALLKPVRFANAQVIGVVSREQVITRVVKFPSTEARELAQMTELYAKAQLPYPRDQVVVGSHVLVQQEGFSTIAIVACQRDIIERHLALLREAGLSPGLLAVSSWGVLGWYRQAVRTAPTKEPSLVVNVDDNRTDFVLISDGRILSSRSVAQGLQDWRGAAETTELLALEVERSRASIRKELPGTEVRSLVLTGLGELGQWQDALSQRLGLPATVIDGRQALAGSRGASMATPVSPVVVGGLACGGLQGALNLIPPEVKEQAHHRSKVQELVTVGALLMGVLALGSGLLLAQAFRQKQTAEQLDQAVASIEPTARRVQDTAHLAQLVGSMLEHRRQLATILSGVFRATPSEVTLEALTFERARREVVLRGSAASTQAVLDYIKRLEALEGVSGAQLRYSTRRATPSGGRTDFELFLAQPETERSEPKGRSTPSKARARERSAATPS